jgi:hypothetical protein
MGVNQPRTLEEQIANWCRHFNGVQNETCRIGIAYRDVRAADKKLPCLKNEGCSHLCPSASFRTPEEVALQAEQEREAAKLFLQELAEGKTCPHCHKLIERRAQVGRCVYALPCGCRLYQGTKRQQALWEEL